MTCLGLDIGGANLKAADGRGWARSVRFALWRDPQGLTGALAALVETAPAAERLAVTMTGELCDCFRSKAEGVRHILAAVERIAGRRDIRVYLVDGRLVGVTEALDWPHLAAASNWHALGRFACRFINEGDAILIDVGSTTTDVIPLVGGRVAARGRNDTERLLQGELLYRGVGRTPICAVMATLPWRGMQCPVSAEVFATTADAFLLTGDLAEDAEADWTADGRPLTLEHSRQRLARQLCADAADFAPDNFLRLATAVQKRMIGEVARSIETVSNQMPVRPASYILSGSGSFIGQLAIECESRGSQLICLAAEIGEEASRCAPAHAVASLAADEAKIAAAGG